MNSSGGSNPDPARPAIVNPALQASGSLDAHDPLATGPIGSAGTLDTDLDSTQAVIEAEERQASQQMAARRAAESRGRLVRFGIIAIILIIGVVVILLRRGSGTSLNATNTDASQRFPATSIPLANLAPNASDLAVTSGQTLSVNGQLNVNNSLVIAPTTRPDGAVTGQLYYDKATNQLSLYNGSTFVNILSGTLPTPTPSTSIGGATGNVSLGGGLSLAGNQLSNSGVLTLQGESGNVTLAAGPGIVINGTTLSSSGALSVGGLNGDIAVGSGLSTSGGNLHNTGIISAVGAGTITVTNDGNGNIVIDGPNGGGGGGTVASPGGTIGKIAKFTGVQTIADSLLSDNGTTVTVSGGLTVTGAVTLNAPLSVANGGTGSATAGGARTNLEAAASGSNNDITQLAGLTTALSVSQGGTGVGVLPANGVLLGNGTGAVSGVTSGAAGQCLISTAGVPTFQTCPGSGGVTSVNGLSGVLTLQGVSGGSISSGSGTVTINDATSAVKGLASFNSTNLTVVNGNVNTIQNIGTTANPTFAGLTLTGALTVANGGTGLGTLTASQLLFANSSSSISQLSNGTSGQCLLSNGAGVAPSFQTCTGAGGVSSLDTLTGALTISNTTGAGSTITITSAKADGSTKGIAAFNATNFKDNGSGLINTIQDINSSASPTFNALTLSNALTVANGGTGLASLVADELVFASTSSTIGQISPGNAGQCLTSGGAGVAPSWQDCPGAGGGGVSSLNGLTGVITLDNASGAAGHITIANASTSGTKGIATFNNTNFKDNGSGLINTIQDIAVTSAPTFGQLTVTSGQATGDMLVVNNTNIGATGNLLNLELGGASKLSVAANGNLTSGLVNGQTISNTANFTGSLTVGTTLTVNTISPTSSMSIGVGGQAFTLQGNASSIITSTDGTHTTTVGFQAPSANATYTFPDNVAGSYDICTTQGNCAGSGGGVTTSGGSANTLAKFTSGNAIGNSIITDNGTTVTIGGTLAVNTITPTGALTVGATSQNLALQGANVSLKANAAGITNSLTFATPSGSNKTITIPNATGTVAVSATGPLALDSAGNLTCPTCLTGGGGGGSGVSSVNGATGDLTLQGSDTASFSTVGTTITVSDASATVKGLAKFNSADLTVTSGSVDTIQGISTTSTPQFGGLTLTSALTVANGGTGAATLTSNGVVVGHGTGALTAVTGTNGQCLLMVSGAPAFGTCTGAGGVSSLDSLTGALTINNTSGSGTAITINDAKADGGTTKGIASFNATNFKDNGSGVINTIQDINSTATPTFGGLTLNTALGVSSGGTGLGTLTANQLLFANSTTSISQLSNGTSGQCLVSNGAGSAPSFQTCTGAGGVSSINSLTGAVTMDYATGAAGHVTIQDAKADNGTTKGVASFNSTNFSASSGTINTIQGIATTSTPSFAGLTLTSPLGVGSGGTGLSTLTANGILYASSTSAVSQLGVGTSGQCLISNGTGSAPSFQTCTGAGGVASLNSQTGAITLDNASGSGGHVTIQNAAADGLTKGIATFNTTDLRDNGSGLIDTIQGIATTSTPQFAGLTLTSALTVGNGGTGLSALTANELVYASSTSTLSQLGNGSSGQCLISNGGASAPSFQTCTGAGGVSSVNGLTGSITIDNATGAAGHITIANAAADGSTKGIAAFNATNFSASSGVVNTIQGIATTSTPSFAGLTLTSPLGVGSGGTGLSTLTAHALLYGSSASAISQLGTGTSGQCLISGGSTADPAWASCAGSTGITGSGTSGKLALFNGTTTVTSSDVTDTVGTNLTVGSGVSLTIQGTSLFKPASNSPTALQVQNSTGGAVFNVDTTNGIVGTGATATASTNSMALILQSGNATGTTSTAGNVTLDTGTSTTGSASVSIGTGNAGTINIGSTGSTAKGTAIHIGDTTSTTNAQTVTVGSAAANTGNVTTIQGGSNTTAAIVIAPAVAGGVTVGNAAGTGTITVGNSTASNTINIGNAVTATGNTQTINVGAGADAGTGKAAVTIGDTHNASITTLQAGTGGLWINTGNNSTSGTGSIIIQSGDATSSGTAGNISIDTGNSAASSSTNVVTYSFEDGTTQVFDNGDSYGSTLSNATPGFAQAGTHVLAATESAGNGNFWGIGQNHGSGSIFAATPGLQYKFSAWVRAATLPQTISGTVAWENAGNATISTISLSTITDNTTGWTQITGAAVAPAGTIGGAFAFANNGDGNASSVTYFDSISVSAQGGAPTLLLGSSNAQSINIGNGNQSWATTIQSGSGDIDMNTGSGGINITTGVGSAGIKVQTTANTATAFQVQNASSFAVLTVSTSGSQVILGDAGHVNGSLAFNDSGDSNTIGLSAASGGVLNTTATGAGAGTFGAPTLGTYTSLGGPAPNTISCSLFTFAARQNATANSITLYTAIGASATNKAYGLAIYTGNGNQPTTQVATATGTLSTTAGANTLSISASLTANTQYWLCANTQNTTAQLSLDFGSQAAYWNTAQTYGTWPSTISSAGIGSLGALEMTVGYTLAGTGSTIQNVSNTGQITMQGVANNNSAFQVQDAAGNGILNISTGGNARAGVNITGGYLMLNGLISAPTGVSAVLSSKGSAGLPANTQMNYYVDAVDSQGNHTTAIDATGSAWLATNGTGTQKATISWSAVSGAVSYTVYWTTNGGTFYSRSVPTGTTTLVDDGTVFSAAQAANNTSAPSIYGNETTGIVLQSGNAIRLNGLNDSTNIAYTQYKQLLLDNGVSGGSVTLQADSFVYNDENSGLSVFQINGSGATTLMTPTNTASAFVIQNSGGSATALQVSTVNVAGTANAANAILKLGKDSVTNRSINAAGSINQNGADYAEYFGQAVHGQLQPGDIACIASGQEAEKCNGDPNSELLGVVSTDPGLVGNDKFDGSDPGGSAIISMLGQVPVKASNAKGAIQTGDMLTFDPATGLAVKATGASMTIGSALEDFNSTTGMVNIYIHIGYYDPMGVQTDGVSNGYVVQGGSATLSNLTVSGTATISVLKATTANIGTLMVSVALSTAEITINGHIVTGGGTPTVAAGTTSGTSTNVTVSGSDTSGKITITLGTGVTAGDLANLTFHAPYSAAPNVTITAGDSNAAQVQQYVTPTTTGFNLNAATSSSLTAGQTYTFYYHVIQ